MLGPEPEARRRIDVFRRELERTRLAFPGVDRRRASLEKTAPLVEERLSREARRVREGEAAGFVRELMFGDGDLGRDLGLCNEDVLGVVSAPLVRRGATLLDGLAPEALFSGEGGEEYHSDSYRRWRDLFWKAAAAKRPCWSACAESANAEH